MNAKADPKPMDTIECARQALAAGDMAAMQVAYKACCDAANNLVRERDALKRRCNDALEQEGEAAFRKLYDEASDCTARIKMNDVLAERLEERIEQVKQKAEAERLRAVYARGTQIQTEGLRMMQRYMKLASELVNVVKEIERCNAEIKAINQDLQDNDVAAKAALPSARHKNGKGCPLVQEPGGLIMATLPGAHQPGPMGGSRNMIHPLRLPLPGSCRPLFNGEISNPAEVWERQTAEVIEALAAVLKSQPNQ